MERLLVVIKQRGKKMSLEYVLYVGMSNFRGMFSCKCFVKGGKHEHLLNV